MKVNKRVEENTCEVICEGVFFLVVVEIKT